MSRDDELRGRLSNLAESVEPAEVTLDRVEARGRRRTLQQRGLAVLASFVLVVGAAVTVRTLTADDGTTDVASGDTDAVADTSGGTADSEAGDDAVAPSTTESADDMAAIGLDDGAYFEGEGDGGPDNRIHPWGDGFISFGQRYVEAADSLADLIPDLEERFPPEIIEAMRDAGIAEGDAYTVEDAMAILDDAGLLDLATQIVTDDPELLDAYMQATGGTYEAYAERSADGVTWQEFTFTPPPGADETYVEYVSNGTHLVGVMSNSHWDDTARRSTGTDISVWVTTDLATWTELASYRIEPDERPWVMAEGGASSPQLSDDHWFVTVNEWRYIDLWQAMPADVRDQMMTDGSYPEPSPEGVLIQRWPEPELTEDGYLVDEEYGYDAVEPITDRVVSWDDLPFTYEDYFANEGDNRQFSLSGSLDGGAVLTGELPGGTQGYAVTGTDAGFVAASWTWAIDEYLYEGGLDADLADAAGSDYPTVSPATTVYPTVAPDVASEPDFAPTGAEVSMWFSADGNTWTPAEVPPGELGWIESMARVEGGVLLTGGGVGGEQQLLWVGSPTGTDWEPVAGPELGDRWVWFGGGAGTGVASVIDVAPYDDPGWAAYSVSFEYEGRTFSIERFASGDELVIIADTATGEVILDRSVSLSEDQAWSWGADETFDFPDDDGEIVASVPASLFDEYVWPAEEEAWAASEAANPYVPEFVVIATRDGRTWMVEPLPSRADLWYEGAAVNGDTVVVRSADGWLSLPFG